ncbi:isocitrate/isopropylmalate family dehydrogenase [Halopseudomonas pachastrellae]|nr:isocitrate/isopropylmalate family dehydrogenase [Halopseudomonas pachastrellae]
MPDHQAQRAALLGDMYTEVFAEIAAEFPEIGVHHELVDAACMKFVQCPWTFDVVVASNLHGDILTDLAAVLSGGLGLAPSCNINPDSRAMPALFEPTHGSAPDIAGQGLANPAAMLLTTALMLDWVGCAQAAERLRQAVAKDLATTAGERRTCRDVTAGVIAALH